MLVEVGESLPPLLAQVMGLVEAEQRHAGSREGAYHLVGLVLAKPGRGTDGVVVLLLLFVKLFRRRRLLFIVGGAAEGCQQRLVGDDGDIARRTYVGGHQVILFGLQEGRADALPPLMLDGVGGTEDERGPPDAGYHLYAEGGLACTRSRHHVQLAVAQVIVEVIEYTLLVTPPCAIEMQYRYHKGCFLLAKRILVFSENVRMCTCIN